MSSEAIHILKATAPFLPTHKSRSSSIREAIGSLMSVKATREHGGYAGNDGIHMVWSGSGEELFIFAFDAFYCKSKVSSPALEHQPQQFRVFGQADQSPDRFLVGPELKAAEPRPLYDFLADVGVHRTDEVRKGLPDVVLALLKLPHGVQHLGVVDAEGSQDAQRLEKGAREAKGHPFRTGEFESCV